MIETLLESIVSSPRLPSAPAMAIEILKLVRQPNVDLNQIAKCIKADPALAAKVLRTVNSSFYGAGVPVSRIELAVVKLGIQAVTTLALGFTLISASEGLSPDILDLNRFWRRSLYAAVSAREIAVKTGAGISEEAFLAGLLQDLGMLALVQHMRSDYAELLGQAGHSGLRRMERERFGVDHAEIGAALGKRWKLPPVLFEPILYHEDPDDAPEASRPLTRAVALGAHAADALLAEGMASPLNYMLRAELWFGLEHEAAVRLLSSIAERTAGMADVFDIPEGKIKSVTDILAEANELLVELSLQAQHRAADLQRQHDYMAQVARTDALTGVANRRAFDEFAAACFGITRHCPLSLISFDLDHFKAINDQYGHAAGDEVLAAIGRLLRILMPENGLAARVGGEEFALVMPVTTAQGALELAEAIRTAIEREGVEACEETLRVTASFGVATVEGQEDVAHLHQLQQASDQALYAAKAGGRNRTCVSAVAADGAEGLTALRQA